MKHYLDFISSQNLLDNEIFNLLKCTQEEGKILQYMAKQLILGENEFVVHELLVKACSTQSARNLSLTDSANKPAGQYLHYLYHIRNLIELGWLAQSTFLQNKPTDIALLELYNETICLSHTFLKLLEDGALFADLPEITAYEDHLEYLKDCFAYIDLLHKTSSLKWSQKLNSPSLSHANHRLKLMEERINARLKITHKDLRVLKLIKDNHLDKKEQIIFFALLKEEYTSSDESLRDMNALLELISHDEYDKIKNRPLLDETSTLVQKGLIDYEESLGYYGGISRHFFIPEQILQSIIHSKKRPKTSLDTLLKEQDIFELLEPKQDLKEIILDDSTREILDNLLAQVNANVAHLLKLWGIREKRGGISAKVLLYGPPGTGKTITALALAKSLKKQILSFDCSKILSKWVGESEKNVRKIFDSYKDISQASKTQPILLLNEADQFLSSRGQSASSVDKMHNQMQNIFLEQIERFEGILIATTNLLEHVDSAFSRRFEYKIAFKRPNLAQREALWLKHLPKAAPYGKDSKEELAKALSEYDLSGGQIALVVKNTAYKVATKPQPIFHKEDFLKHIKAELSGNFDGEKSMGFRR